MLQSLVRQSTALGASIIIFCSACKKDHTPTRESFNVTYKFINEGDENLWHVVLRTITVYPNYSIDVRGDSTWTVDGGDGAYSNVGAYENVIVPMKIKGYIGCTLNFDFIVDLKKPVFSPVYDSAGWSSNAGTLPVGLTTSRVYRRAIKTIASPADSVIIVRWPSDTIYFKEQLFRF